MPWFLRASLNCNLVCRSLLVAFGRYTAIPVRYHGLPRCFDVRTVFCWNHFLSTFSICNDQCMFKEVSLSWRHRRDSRYSSCGGVSCQNVGSCFASVMCPFMEDANGFLRFHSNPLGWMVDPSTALSSYPFIPEGLKRRSEANSDLNLYEYINGWPSDIVQIALCFPLHLYNSRLHWFYWIQSRSWWNRWRIAPQKPLDRHENTFNNFRISAKKQFFPDIWSERAKNQASTVIHLLRRPSFTTRKPPTCLRQGSLAPLPTPWLMTPMDRRSDSIAMEHWSDYQVPSWYWLVSVFAPVVKDGEKAINFWDNDFIEQDENRC